MSENEDTAAKARSSGRPEVIRPKEISIDGDKCDGLTGEILQVVGTYAEEHGLKPPEVVLALATAISRVIEFVEKPPAKVAGS